MKSGAQARLVQTGVNGSADPRKLRQCALWNQSYPVGTEVIRTDDAGKELLTRTRSEAQVLGGHSAVIWIDGVSGCYALDRVKAVPHG